MKTLRNYIGGEWIAPGSVEYLELTNPATGESLGKVPLSGARAVNEAVAAAQAAFLKWREVPPVVRARYLFKLKYLMEEHFDDLATTVTRENGKTLDEARGSVRRGIENVEHACGIPALMMGKTLEDVAAGIDCEYVRQPLGVFAAITPFNFPAMVPCWFWPYAIATGNTFILKPSEQVPFSPTRLIELAHEAGIPAGVLNLVHGGKDAVNALLAHPGITGISFVGSSPVAKYVYQEGAKYGKRVQALGGA
jgi:malonate-semialdehyde dehydrogenase (acetylating)/methylmalonate-semialdehyde dehydrogenase